MNHNTIVTIAGFYLLAILLPVSVLLLARMPNLWHHLFALFLGMLVGYLDLHSDDPQFAVLLLLVFGFFLGYSHTTNAWRWALLLGVWVPIFGILKILYDGTTDRLVSDGVFSLLALVPAFIGVYVGVFIKGMIVRTQSTPR